MCCELPATTRSGPPSLARTLSFPTRVTSNRLRVTKSFTIRSYGFVTFLQTFRARKPFIFHSYEQHGCSSFYGGLKCFFLYFFSTPPRPIFILPPYKNNGEGASLPRSPPTTRLLDGAREVPLTLTK